MSGVLPMASKTELQSIRFPFVNYELGITNCECAGWAKRSVPITYEVLMGTLRFAHPTATATKIRNS
jgi:hypothetical protein